MNKRLEELLGVSGVHYARVAHSEAFTASEEAALAHVSGWAWAKTVAVKDPVGLALAVLPACCTADLNRLKGLIGRGEIRLATVEEMLAGFPDCALGSIPPFGELFGVPTVVEGALLEQRDIVLPTGDRGIALRMRAEDYLRLAEARPGRFAVHDSQQFPVHPPLQTRAVETGP
ncbi:MAG TPA: YbaK/EbsC family protein [Methylomirabilota bacterium]|jgi:Ala-tRNA(Pro) deacylase